MAAECGVSHRFKKRRIYLGNFRETAMFGRLQICRERFPESLIAQVMEWHPHLRLRRPTRHHHTPIRLKSDQQIRHQRKAVAAQTSLFNQLEETKEQQRLVRSEPFAAATKFVVNGRIECR